jgi:hypothetical protein
MDTIDFAEQRRSRILAALSRALLELDLILPEECRVRLADAADGAVEPVTQGTEAA